MVSITPTELLPDQVVEAVGYTINPELVGSGVTLVDPDPVRLFIRVTNSTTGQLNVLLLGGDRPPGMAPQTKTFPIPPNGVTQMLGPFDSGSVIFSTGRVEVIFDTGFTGEIEFYQIARNA